MENSGVVHMLMHTRTLELACVYKLLSRVAEGLRTVADAVSAHLREQGRALVTDTHHNTNAITFVQVYFSYRNNILQIYNRFTWLKYK